jgi:hypothetical protein
LEFDDMRHCQSVTGAPNAARGQGSTGPQNAAKLQRAMAADPDVNRYGLCKFIEVNNVGVLCDNIYQAAGQDSGDGSCIRTPLGTMRDLRASLGTAINEKGFTRDEKKGGCHALCPESLYNARRNADPPRKLFPNEETHPDRAWPEGVRPYNPALEAFMVSPSGLPLEVCDDQVNPNNYFNSDGFTTFPFPKSVAFLARATDNFQMSAMPLPLPSSVIVGDAALKSFYVYHKSRGSEPIAVMEREALLELASEMVEQRRAVSAEIAAESLQSDGRPAFDDLKDRLLFFFDNQMRHDQEGVGVRRSRLQQLLQVDSLDRGPNERGGRMSGKREGGIADQRITLATEELVPFINEGHVFCKGARDWKLAQPGARKDEVQREFADAVSDVMLWGVELFIKTYTDAETEQSLAPKAVQIWHSFADIRRRLPDYAPYAVVDPRDPRRNEGSINYAFMFRNFRQKTGVSVRVFVRTFPQLTQTRPDVESNASGIVLT